jgi:hypothetical protein
VSDGVAVRALCGTAFAVELKNYEGSAVSKAAVVYRSDGNGGAGLACGGRAV